jgi:hypothetical protein
VPVRPHDVGIRLTRLFFRRQTVILHPVPVALHPVCRAVCLPPVGGHHSEGIERSTERFTDTLSPVDGTDMRQAMGRVGPLTPSRLEPLALATLRQ